MRSLFLVLLALIAGASAGAGIAVAWLGGATDEETSPGPVQISRTGGGKVEGENKSSPIPESERLFERLANALLTIDERLSAMEARDEATAVKQKKLIDDVRELAIHLEVRSGELEPLHQGPVTGLQPLRPDSSVLPFQGARTVPSSSASDKEGVLPEW